MRLQFVFLLWSLQSFLSCGLQLNYPPLPPGLFICFTLHIVGFSKGSKRCCLSRFYSNQVLHKTRIRSHLHCLIFLFPLIIPLLFLLPMQFSFFSNIIQNYREFRYCFFYICNCSDTLSQLDLYLTSRFPWADMYSLSCKYCKSGIQKLSYPVNLIEVLFQYLTEPLKPPFLPTTSRAGFG